MERLVFLVVGSAIVVAPHKGAIFFFTVTITIAVTVTVTVAAAMANATT